MLVSSVHVKPARVGVNFWLVRQFLERLGADFLPAMQREADGVSVSIPPAIPDSIQGNLLPGSIG